MYAQINWVLQRNIFFLEDYYRSEYPHLTHATTQLLHSIVSSQPGIELNQLLRPSWGIKPDDIYFLIATEQIYVDLSAAPLVEPQRCKVFPDRSTAKAYSTLMSSSSDEGAISLPVVDIVPSTPICWDGGSYTIVTSGETEIILRNESGELVELLHSEWNRLIRLGKIYGTTTNKSSTSNNQLKDLILRASPADLEPVSAYLAPLTPSLFIT